MDEARFLGRVPDFHLKVVDNAEHRRGDRQADTSDGI